MSLTKKLLLAAAGLLVVVLIGVTWLVLSFDPNRYKGVAIDWVREHKQRTLSLEGPIRLSVFPRLAVRLDQVALSEFQKAEPFVKLESASLSIQLMPLLHQQLVVHEIHASGLNLHYKRDAEGHSNIDDLLQPSAKPAEPKAAAQPLNFDVSGITLENLQARIDDDQGHLHGDITLENLTTGRLSPDVLTPIRIAALAKLSEPAASAHVQATLKLQLDPGSPATEQAALRPFKLDVQDLDLKLDAATGAIALQDTHLGLGRLQLEPAHQKISLDKLLVQLRGQLTDAQGSHPMSVELNWPQLAVNGKSLQGSPLSGNFSLQGPAAVQGRIESGAPTGSFDALDIPGFKLVLGGGTGPTRLQGTIQTHIKVQPPTSQVQLAALSIDAQVQDPNLKPLTVQAKGDVAASPQTTRWALAGQLNGQAFDLDGQISMSKGAPPRLVAKAQFGELDLDALLPPRAPAPPPAASAADIPVNLAGLRAINADVSLKAASLKYKPFVIRDLLAQAKLEGGHLVLAPLSLKAWDGGLDAQVVADAAQQLVAVKTKATGINIQGALKDVANLDLVEGKGHVQADVSTHGATVNAMKAALNGTAAVQLRDGALHGINLARSLREFKAKLTLQKDAIQEAQKTEKTDFSELSASFQILDGVANNRDLDMKSPFLRLAGSGFVNLPQSSLDYTARTTVTSVAKGQDGMDPALQGLTVPVRLSGPFSAMAWKIQWSDISMGSANAGAALKQALDNSGAAAKLKAPLAAAAASLPSETQVKQQLEQQARDQVQNKLKGLFK
ncbi:MAG: AsmA family protein [Leptothrix ochracea]|uniref:AsmA family protein n=1 Tax=Leptothrix ochracea TaxID=735331 RepID=UPI0034E22170